MRGCGSPSNVYCLSDLSPATKSRPAGVLWKHCGIEAHAEHPLAKTSDLERGHMFVGNEQKESRVLLITEIAIHATGSRQRGGL